MFFLLQHTVNPVRNTIITAGYVSAENLEDAVKRTALARFAPDDKGGMWLCDEKGRNWHLILVEEAIFPLRI